MALAHRSNNFDAVRIFAALVVIFGHAHPLSGTQEVTVLGNAVQSIAVKIFFIVSGYLVAKSWQSDPNVVRYLMRRGMRLLPGLGILLFLTVFVLGPIYTELPVLEYLKNYATLHYLLLNILLCPVYNLPGVFLHNAYPVAVNGSLWSLPVEVLMYIALPILFTITMKKRMSWLFILWTFLLFFLAFRYLEYTSTRAQLVVWGTGLRSVADVGPYFFMGSLYALTVIKNWLNAPMALFVVAIVALFQPENYLIQQVMLLVSLPYAVLSFATLASPIVSKMGRFGDPSYGVYLYGFPVQQALFHVFGVDMGVVANAFFAAIVALLFGYASWHLIEKRVLALKPASGKVTVQTIDKGVLNS